MAYIDKIVVNGQEVDSSKPTYFHSIEIRMNNTNYSGAITLVIISDANNAFTLAGLKAWLDNLASVVSVPRVMISGGIYDKANSKTVISSFLYEELSIYGIVGINTANGNVDDVSSANWDTFFESATLNDCFYRIH